jgi:hypothetical protein
VGRARDLLGGGAASIAGIADRTRTCRRSSARVSRQRDPIVLNMSAASIAER